MVILLYIVLIFLIALLISLVETVVLTLLRWATFRQCLVSATVANLVSTFITVLLMVWYNQPRMSYLAIGWLISTLIDALILNRFRRHPALRNLLTSAAANLVSYLLLILPAFYYGQKSPF